jgi:hypothetical protein
MREKTQADYEIERMFAYLDEAMTSKDDRVQSALRGLLTIIELTRPQDDGRMAVETKHGPLRQMQEDLKSIRSRLANVENEVRQRNSYIPPTVNPYMPGPGIIPSGPYASSSTTFNLTDVENDSTLNPATITIGK